MFEDNCYYYDHGDQDFLCNFPTLQELEESVKRFIDDFHAVKEDGIEYDISEIDLRVSLDARNKPFPEIASWPVGAPEYGYFCRTHSFDPEDGDLWVDVSEITQFSHLDDAHALAVELHEFLRDHIQNEIEGAAQLDAMIEADIAADEAYEQAHSTNVIIEFTKTMSVKCVDEIRLFDRCIVRYSALKHQAKTDKHFVESGFLSGLPRCNGSTKFWKLIIPAGSVVELAHVKRDLLARELPTVQAEHPDLRITIRDKSEDLDPAIFKRAALESKKSSLLAQVAQIDAELATLTT